MGNAVGSTITCFIFINNYLLAHNRCKQIILLGHASENGYLAMPILGVTQVSQNQTRPTAQPNYRYATRYMVTLHKCNIRLPMSTMNRRDKIVRSLGGPRKVK